MKCRTKILYAVAFFNFLLMSVSGRGSSDKKWIPQKEIELLKKDTGDIVDALIYSEECSVRKCQGNYQCCKGYVCVILNENLNVGTCLPIYPRIIDHPCPSDVDCIDFLKCLKVKSSKVCHTEIKNVRKRRYNEQCLTSSECDMDKGLCCQLQRRHRMAPRKACYYFTDPKSCIGLINTIYTKPVHFELNPFFKARLG
ncbi:prohormone-3 isoform X1 [Centruroides vittatus]|uniref:prohormone-3 isoform X1 n=1 Tax=Centruroides vittatus TaxID=120091 RepID=UPI00350F7249